MSEGYKYNGQGGPLAHVFAQASEEISKPRPGYKVLMDEEWRTFPTATSVDIKILAGGSMGVFGMFGGKPESDSPMFLELRDDRQLVALLRMGDVQEITQMTDKEIETIRELDGKMKDSDVG